MAEPFDAVDVIRAKRDGGVVPEPALRWLIDAYTREYVQDAQMSAFAMAVLLNGMTRDEIRVMTDAMIASGERMSFDALGKPTTDKHSTGGVGDKITLPLAPLVASYGVAVPQLSGRGLGHTGGTLDKLESISGWRAALTNDEMFAQMHGPVGAVICAAGSGLAPADKRLYALRDVTGTVEAIPLIASSIMSKKIAEGTGSLVLDVKFGSGAFMKDFAQAKELAETMVALGTDSGVKTTALLTGMSTPLGLTVGNANEVRESVEVLAGGGPSDVVELTLALAREMLTMSGIDDDPADALADGRAMDTWRAMIRAQAGDPDAPLPTPRETHVVRAERDGVLTRLDAYDVGIAAWRLGAGRARAADPVVHAAGVDLHAKPGDRVRAGEPLFTLNADDADRFDRALEALAGSYEIGDTAPEIDPIVRERITSA